jgi:hypothetical protein
MKSFFILIFCFMWGCYSSSGLTGDVAPDHGADTRDSSESDAAADFPQDVRLDEIAQDADVSEFCLAQDAGASGDCAMELPGVKWNGSRCVPLGSGCSCAGSDCAALYDTVTECVEARRSCYDVGCDPQPVADTTCYDCDSWNYLGAFWTGRECFDFQGCGCVGDGCAGAFASLDECAALQRTCDASLCLATGGRWFPSYAGFCGFVCGAPSSYTCMMDSCDCGLEKTFVPGAGCADDPSCGPMEACLATRGTWHPASECICGFSCGRQNVCGACLDSCDCGPHRNFDETLGCFVDAQCEPVSREQVCAATGGTWMPEGSGSCGDYFCGIPNTLDPCVSAGCNCGFNSNFNSDAGCSFDDTCFFKERGQECTGWAGSSTCRAGLACCAHCGIPNGCMTCDDPCCPDWETCMEDGCPIPPP